MSAFRVLAIGASVVGAVVALGFIANVAITAGTVAMAPGRVIQKTLETDNIISSYEWFHDVNAQFKVRLSQVNAHKALTELESDRSEKQRLRVELSSISASCSDLANRYNANAIKINKSIFMGRDAPESLNPELCK